MDSQSARHARGIGSELVKFELIDASASPVAARCGVARFCCRKRL